MRTFVMGDPQGPFDKVLAVLGRHDALAGDRLASDVVLVSIGDHFDYDHKHPDVARAEGLRLLRWLASHDPAQVYLVLGNHDAARVMELAHLSDAEFALARTCGDYDQRFPTLPPQHVLARDYSSFSVEQRELVAELLEARRFHLALVGTCRGRDALITHAGVTSRELGMLGLPQHDARAIAASLESFLEVALRKGVAPLSLEPLHIAGGDGREGGGLLYHRPSATPPPDPSRPRRFDPRTLPDGVLQIVGHSGHAKCVHELGDWCTFAARDRAHGGLRTLRIGDDAVPSYDMGVDYSHAGMHHGNVTMLFVDGELRRVPADEVDLLAIDGLA
jgi:hypothetical protein